MKPHIKLVAAFLFWPAFLPMSAMGADDSAASASTPSFPWTQDQALLKTLVTEVQSGGIMAVGPHAADLEQVLAKPQLTYSAGSTVYVLTDGPGETMIAMVALGAKSGTQTVAMSNPYPTLSLYLASYYDETGKPDQALRVLDVGLKLSPMADFQLGDTVPELTAERGAALGGLKRWQDEIDNEDAGLKIKGASDSLRALLYRGRGFALTELGRLDEAEASYEESLKLQPGNALAERELKYIAGLRAGAKPDTGGGIIPLQPAKSPPSQ